LNARLNAGLIAVNLSAKLALHPLSNRAAPRASAICRVGQSGILDPHFSGFL
jgi:hypothetical protein